MADRATHAGRCARSHIPSASGITVIASARSDDAQHLDIVTEAGGIEVVYRERQEEGDGDYGGDARDARD